MESVVRIKPMKKTTYPYIGLYEKVIDGTYVIKNVYVLFYGPDSGVCITSADPEFAKIGDHSLGWGESKFVRISNETSIELHNT